MTDDGESGSAGVTKKLPSLSSSDAAAPCAAANQTASSLCRGDRLWDAISGLTISGGSTDGSGSGIYNTGIVTVATCTIFGNSGRNGGEICNGLGIYKLSDTPKTDAGVAYTLDSTHRKGVSLFEESPSRYQVVPRQQIVMRVYVDDLSGSGAEGGVYSAYADLLHDSDLIEWDPATLAGPDADAGY